MIPDELFPSDLLTNIRANLGTALVDDIVAGAESRVRRDSAAYSLSASDIARLVRAIAHFDLRCLVGGVPPEVQRAYDAANTELTAMRTKSLEVESTEASIPVTEERTRTHTRDDQDGL